LGEEKKKGRFIYVTVDEPDQPQHKFTFFTDVSSASILTGATGPSNIYLLPKQYEELRGMLDTGRENNADGTLLESSLPSGTGTVRLNVKQAKGEIKLFISYVKEDFSAAYGIYQKLRQEGYDLWIDKGKLVGGQEWDLEIIKAIEESNFFLACISSNSVDKQGYYQKELKKGMDVWEMQPEGRIYFIPVRLENCQIPIKLSKFHRVEFFEGDGMEKLLKAIEKGCEKRRAFT
jgi:hypothetical protein